ncbi:uncharacterized protein [Bos taurus]|uniref:uncharacterized protein n=1 Tax=Bos taurus TaxID=9913 RepID=UPI0000EBD62D|nr:uncharacterized protein LOC132342149 [Bos taurus]DAA22609.1 TPA: hypothetical protein BOS_14080 [Bos taurus]
MRAPSGGPSRAFRGLGGAPRAEEGTWATPVRGPGPCAAANGLRDDARPDPATPGPWRRVALRTQTCRGLVTMATAAQAGSPRSVYSKTRPASSGCRTWRPYGPVLKRGGRRAVLVLKELLSAFTVI